MRRTPEQLISDLSGAVDPALAGQVINSYVEMQQRYLSGDWKPSELDGGRLCEAVSRAIYQLDSGTITHSQLPGQIKTKLLDEDKVTRQHNLALKDRQHIVKVIDTVYKFRSDRGAVHISPTHDANAMDAMFIVHAGKWIVSEFLRIAWNKDRSVVAEVIDQLVQMEVALVHHLDGKPLVLVPGISAPDEILLLLYRAPNNRLTRGEIREYAPHQRPGTLQRALSRLIANRDVRAANGDEVALTPKGQKRVLDKVLPKWRAIS